MGGGGDRGARLMAASAGFLRSSQRNEGRGCPPSHPYFGGTGRWPESAPDLLHRALLLQAMRAAGVVALSSAAVYDIEDVERGGAYLKQHRPDATSLGTYGYDFCAHYYAAQAIWIRGRPDWDD